MFKKFSQIGRAMMLPVAIRLVANCRAYAQDGIVNCREIMHLSTERLPKNAKHPTACPSVGRQPRTASRTPERSRICLVFDSQTLMNTRSDINKVTQTKKPLTRHGDQCFFCC